MFKVCDPSSIGIEIHKSKPLKINNPEQQIDKILKPQVPFEEVLKKLPKYMDTISSISAEQFTNIFELLTNPLKVTKKEYIQTILEVLQKLSKLSFNQQEVIRILKNRKIDAIFVISLCWCAEKKQNYLDIVRIMVNCFAVQLMLSGKGHLQKWEQFLNLYIEETQLRMQVNDEIRNKILHEQKLKFKDVFLIF